MNRTCHFLNGGSLKIRLQSLKGTESVISSDLPSLKKIFLSKEKLNLEHFIFKVVLY